MSFKFVQTMQQSISVAYHIRKELSHILHMYPVCGYVRACIVRTQKRKRAHAPCLMHARFLFWVRTIHTHTHTHTNTHTHTGYMCRMWLSSFLI